MERKEFIKSALLTGALGALAPQLLKAKSDTKEESTFDSLMQQVGFNHLPNHEDKKNEHRHPQSRYKRTCQSRLVALSPYF